MMLRYMNLKERLEITRVVVAILLMMIAIAGMFDSNEGWVWFLISGVIIYPSQINIDLREREDGQ